MISLNLEAAHGLVMLVASSTVFLNYWQIYHVGSLRKLYDIKYPTMYSDRHNDFNCAQRVHQNTLENIPFFFGLLLGASLRHPWLAALFGAVFIVGRVKYSVGYYSGSPEGRVPGALISGLGGSLPLLGLSVSSAASFLGWW